MLLMRRMNSWGKDSWKCHLNRAGIDQSWQQSCAQKVLPAHLRWRWYLQNLFADFLLEWVNHHRCRRVVLRLHSLHLLLIPNRMEQTEYLRFDWKAGFFPLDQFAVGQLLVMLCSHYKFLWLGGGLYQSPHGSTRSINLQGGTGFISS